MAASKPSAIALGSGTMKNTLACKLVIPVFLADDVG